MPAALYIQAAGARLLSEDGRGHGLRSDEPERATATNERLERAKVLVEQVKGKLAHNIDIAMANRADLEHLQLESERMEALSKGFNTKARRIKRDQLWRRVKATAAVAAIGSGVVLGAVIII